MDVYRQAGELDQAGIPEIYGVLIDNRLVELGIEPGEILGAAVDIGTTGISAYLLDLATGEILNKLSCRNRIETLSSAMSMFCTSVSKPLITSVEE